jgi:hypothetical protein
LDKHQELPKDLAQVATMNLIDNETVLAVLIEQGIAGIARRRVFQSPSRSCLDLMERPVQSNCEVK